MLGFGEVVEVGAGALASAAEEACVGFEFASGGEAEFSGEVVDDVGRFSVVVVVVSVVHQVDFDGGAVVLWVEPDFSVFDF